MNDATRTRVLTDIDAEADNGWCSNWADTRDTASGGLIVILADGTEREYDRDGKEAR